MTVICSLLASIRAPFAFIALSYVTFEEVAPFPITGVVRAVASLSVEYHMGGAAVVGCGVALGVGEIPVQIPHILKISK